MEIALGELEFGKTLASCVQCQHFSESTKLLPCSHILCDDCYRELGSLSTCICPQCGHYIRENEFVEDNYFAELFIRSEGVLEKLKEKQICSKCQHLQSSTYCITCDTFLCSVDFHLEHKQNGDLHQHDSICINNQKNSKEKSLKNNNALRDVFVKSSELRGNDKMNSLYQGLCVYDQLLDIWKGRYRNIGLSLEEAATLEIECISDVSTHYGKIIEKAQDALIQQCKNITNYYEKERNKLETKLAQTSRFVQKLEQTKGLIEIYIEFSDTYELIDKCSALIGRLERIGKEIVETKWQYPDIVPLKFSKNKIRDITSKFGVLSQYRNFQSTFYPQISFGSYGENQGQFKVVQDVAMYKDRTLFVLDSGKKCVNAFSTSGQFLFKFGSHGRRSCQFLDPRYITVYEDYIYISDAGKCDVQIFSCKDGRFMGKLGIKGNQLGLLASPHGIAISKKNNKIFVVDRPKQSVKVFSPSYEFLTEICKGYLLEPSDIAIGPNGEMFVLDCSNRCVHVFDENGKLLREFGQRGEDQELVNPCYLTLDSQHHVIVSDRVGSRMCVYTQQGELVAVFGGFGSGAGQLKFANGLTVDSEGNIFVCDTANHRIQKF